MRERLAEATLPPAQFARMHLRETAVYDSPACAGLLRVGRA